MNDKDRSDYKPRERRHTPSDKREKVTFGPSDDKHRKGSKYGKRKKD